MSPWALPPPPAPTAASRPSRLQFFKEQRRREKETLDNELEELDAEVDVLDGLRRVRSVSDDAAPAAAPAAAASAAAPADLAYDELLAVIAGAEKVAHAAALAGAKPDRPAPGSDAALAADAVKAGSCWPPQAAVQELRDSLAGGALPTGSATAALRERVGLVAAPTKAMVAPVMLVLSSAVTRCPIASVQHAGRALLLAELMADLAAKTGSTAPEGVCRREGCPAAAPPSPQ